MTTIAYPVTGRLFNKYFCSSNRAYTRWNPRSPTKRLACRGDLGTSHRFDIYYGIADCRIGVALIDLPEILLSGGVAESPEGKV
jgi:hypothetical protein